MKTGTYSVALAAEETSADNQQWIHLLPSGQFAARDGRGPWRIDDGGSVISATLEHAGKTDIPVDYEHQTEHAPKNGQPAPAAGWMRQLEARADGIWALVEWTEKAAKMVRAREYRYISPVFAFEAATGAVRRIVNAALTNKPALELTALARETDDGELAAVLRDALGLDESASPEELLAEARAYRERRVVEKVELAIERNEFLPGHRDLGIALCKASPALFEAVSKQMYKPFLSGLMRRQTDEMPDWFKAELNSASDGPTHGLSEAQLAACRALGLDPEYYSKFGD